MLSNCLTCSLTYAHISIDYAIELRVSQLFIMSKTPKNAVFMRRKLSILDLELNTHLLTPTLNKPFTLVFGA